MATRDPGSTHQLRLVVYPIVYKVLYISGGAGFLPSTVELMLIFEKNETSEWYMSVLTTVKKLCEISKIAHLLRLLMSQKIMMIPTPACRGIWTWSLHKHQRKSDRSLSVFYVVSKAWTAWTPEWEEEEEEEEEEELQWSLQAPNPENALLL